MTSPTIVCAATQGPPGAPLIVLGCSLGTSTILWDDVVPLLAQRYRVVSWDLPGHGASPAPTQPFTVGDIANAVAAAVAGERFFYAGVSLGGATGLELLVRHPRRVRAAAIIASGARLGDPSAWHDRAEQVRRQGTSSLIAASAGRWFAPGSISRRPEISGRLLHTLQDADDEGYALCCEALAAYDVRADLGAIIAPVAALWGEHDTVAPEAAADEIAGGVRDGYALRIADAAHLPPAEQPVAVAEAMLAFFDASEKGSANADR
jgi:3-oxoadipate enol-lactonase